MKLALVPVFLVLVPIAAAQDPAAALRIRLLERIAQVPGASVGLMFQELQGGAMVQINADSVFHAASTMKIPVLIEYFRAVEDGRLGADQDLLLVNEFKSIVDGSSYTLSADGDSDSALFARVGQRVPIRDLAERMITRSSNLATNVLIELLGAARIDSAAASLGAEPMRVLRGVEDGKAYQAGLNNTTSARDLAALLMAIETGQAASAASCRQMAEILARQEFNSEIPAGLPPGTRVAHKTGWITGVLHDAALVYPPGRRPYVLVVLTSGIRQRQVARELIADLSRMTFAFVTDAGHSR